MFEGLTPSTPATMANLEDKDQTTPEEKFTGPLLPAAKCGILTNKRKTLHQQKDYDLIYCNSRFITCLEPNLPYLRHACVTKIKEREARGMAA